MNFECLNFQKNEIIPKLDGIIQIVDLLNAPRVKFKHAEKRITVEELAVIVHKGFEALSGEMNRLFSGVDKRLINLESDVSYLKSRVTEIGRNLERHEEILQEHSEELKWLHKKIDELTDPQSEKRVITHREFTKLESRVASLEKKVTAKIS